MNTDQERRLDRIEAALPLTACPECTRREGTVHVRWPDTPEPDYSACTLCGKLPRVTVVRWPE